MAFISVLSHFVLYLTSLYQSVFRLRPRIKSSLAGLLCALLALYAPIVFAQLASVPSAGIELTKLEVLHNVPVGLTLAQVQSGQAGPFVAQPHLDLTHAEWGRAFWLRLHLQASAAQAAQPAQPERAVLALPRPYLDDVRLHTPGSTPAEPWSVQQAGDFFAPDAHSVRSMYPKFVIAMPGQAAWQGGQQMVLYMQIDHSAPVALKLEITPERSMQDRDLLALVLYCLGFGGIVLVALITAAMAWAYRDSIYAWYSAYAACAALACAAHAGLAHHLLWPVSGYWPGTAVLFFILLSCACLMKFTLALSKQHLTQPFWQHVVHVFCVLCVLIAIGFVIFTQYWREYYFATLGAILVTMGAAVILMAMSARLGSKLAQAWLLAFVPLFTTIVLAVLEGVGLLQATDWSYSLVIYAATIEVLVLGLALQWYARARHGERERRRMLSDVDPLTGFVTANAFHAQLQRDWHNQAARKLDHALVYVELRTQATSAAQLEDLFKRSVRIMRSATHTSDVVSRLDSKLMAISMPNVQMGDDLSQRLSRIIALGLMPDRSDPQANVLQFRIAATTHQHFKAPFAQLDVQLRELLAQNTGWGSKPIRFVDGVPRQAAPRSLPAIPDLDDVWEKAFQQEQKDEGAAAKP